MSHCKGIRKMNSTRKPRPTDRTLTFRASAREKREMDYESEICGILKMDYLRTRSFGDVVEVKRSPKVYIGIKKHMLQAAEELKAAVTAEEISDELLQKIRFIETVLNGLKED